MSKAYQAQYRSRAIQVSTIGLLATDFNNLADLRRIYDAFCGSHGLNDSILMTEEAADKYNSLLLTPVELSKMMEKY